MPLAKLSSGRMRIRRKGADQLSGDKDSSLSSSYPTPSSKGLSHSAYAQAPTSTSLSSPTPAAWSGNNVQRTGSQQEDGVATGKSIANGKGFVFGNGNEFRNDNASETDGNFGNKNGNGNENKNRTRNRTGDGNGNENENDNGNGIRLGIGLASAKADASKSADPPVDPIATGQATGNGNGSGADNGPSSGISGGGPINNGKPSGGSGSGPSSSTSEVTQPGSLKPENMSFPENSANTADDIQIHVSTTTLDDGGGIPASAIASIVVVCALFMLGILIYFLRKQSISRRGARHNEWWDPVGSATHGADNDSDGNSARSHSSCANIANSFATAYDPGQATPSSMEFVLPPLPSMAEILWDTITPLMQTQPATNEIRTRIPVSPDISADHRVSMRSVRTTDSSLSDDYSQYLLAVHSNLLSSSELLSPMSVRPFSPSESFPLPSPPISHSRYLGDWTGSLRTPTSSITPATLSNTPKLSRRSRTPPPTIALVRNPFADPSNTRLAELAVIETVKKPHQPWQPGELRVAVEDRVKILRVLENAWALVEKIVPLDETLLMTEKTALRPTRGLIPIECFCWETEGLSHHLAEKGTGGVYAESDDGLAVTARWK